MGRWEVVVPILYCSLQIRLTFWLMKISSPCEEKTSSSTTTHQLLQQLNYRTSTLLTVIGYPRSYTASHLRAKIAQLWGRMIKRDAAPAEATNYKQSIN